MIGYLRAEVKKPERHNFVTRKELMRIVAVVRHSPVGPSGVGFICKMMF